MPEILIDDTADEYVETDDEPGTPSPKTRPPANEIFYQEEEPPEDEQPPPAVEPTFNYVKPASLTEGPAAQGPPHRWGGGICRGGRPQGVPLEFINHKENRSERNRFKNTTRLIPYLDNFKQT